MSSKFRLTAAFTILATCQFASTSRVATSFGPDTALKDDSTQLIWLDLSITKNQSYDYVKANLAPGRIYAQWRFATAPELAQLFADYAGGTVSDELAMQFMNDLGGPLMEVFNPQNGFRRKFSIGLLDVPFDLGHAVYGYIAVDNFYGPSIYPGLSGSSQDSAQADYVGSWLVLDLHAPPLITRDPVSQAARAGDSVRFSASATDESNVQWQFSTDGGATFNNIYGAATNMIRLTIGDGLAVSETRNGYQYRAIFSNARGVAISAAATLHIVDPPLWSLFFS